LVHAALLNTKRAI